MPVRAARSYRRGNEQRRGTLSSKRWIGGFVAIGALLAFVAVSAGARSGSTAGDVALARAGTAKYVTNLALAKQNGYGIITKMIPNMGYHFMNPKLTAFDPAKPPILVDD